MSLNKFKRISFIYFGTSRSSKQVITASATSHKWRCCQLQSLALPSLLQDKTVLRRRAAISRDCFCAFPALSLIEILNVEGVFCCDIGKWRGRRTKHKKRAAPQGRVAEKRPGAAAQK